MWTLNRLKARLLIVFPLLVLAGCQPTVYLMPTPVGIQPGKHDPFVNTADKNRNSEIVIGYATNRQPAGEPDENGKLKDYSRDFDADIRMGVARVEIGDGDRSWEEIYQMSLKGAGKKEARLKLNDIVQMAVLDADQPLSPFNTLSPDMQMMISTLNRAIDESPGQELTLYVHGANSNFYRAAAQAAQYRHFTGHQSIILLYSWPSAENILRYGTDVNNINQSVPNLARYLNVLAKYSSAKNINILAYSAGASLTTQALALLADQAPLENRAAYAESLKLGTIYFAAPDTDFDDFVEQYRSYQDLVDYVNVTINTNDSVLGAANKFFHVKRSEVRKDGQISKKSRLGKPDVQDLSPAQFDWIFAQTFKPEFSVVNIDWETIPGLEKGSHDYWYRNPWTSTDVMLAFEFRAPPQERALTSIVVDGKLKMWSFPADYASRVDTAVDGLIEKFQDE